MFIRRTFTQMVEAVRPQALDARIIDADTFDEGIRDLYRVADTGGVFCYTFFKSVGVNRVEMVNGLRRSFARTSVGPTR
jgi:hypothetical protein